MKQPDTKTPTKTVSKDAKKEVKAKKVVATTPEKEKALLDQKPESEGKEEKGKHIQYTKLIKHIFLHRSLCIIIIFNDF